MKTKQLQRSKNFENAKNDIKKFSSNIPTGISLSRVEEGVLWGLIDRNVTGKEFNDLVNNLQASFLRTNEILKGIIKEFGEVYTALDFLDKDYIQTFLITFEEIGKNHEKIKKNNDEIYQTQKDLNKTIQGLKLTIDKFSEFKAKYEREVSNIQNELSTIKNTQKELSENIKYTKELKKIFEKNQHLNDIDNIWEDVQNQKTSIQALFKDTSEHKNTTSKNIESINKNLQNLNKHTDNLNKLRHLQNVDSTWNEVQNHTEKLSKYEQKIKNLYIIVLVLAFFIVGLIVLNILK